MKSTLYAVALLALIGLVGCSNPSNTGGPGADKDKAKTEKDKGKAESKGKVTDDTFSLSLPTGSTSIKQGESKTVTISITRGKNFDEDVGLKLQDAPKGITLDPAAPMIKHGDKETKVTIKAADDAALGDHTIHVVGHPTKGADATGDFKITVDKK